jgi:hypothetical protein
MKRITVITPASATWTLPKQPFHRCLLLASLQNLYLEDSEPRIVARIYDASGNVIWRQSVNLDSGFITGNSNNVTFSVQGCETKIVRTTGTTDFGVPLPEDLTIPANFTFDLFLQGTTSQDVYSDLILTTDDPFLDGARPFDDLQAP